MVNSVAANAADWMSNMQSHAADGSNQSGDNSSTDKAASDTSDLFLKLLIAQLKTQDPTSPMDPTQMVGQMLSMNQLNELIQIRQLLQGVTTPATD
jgi:flagellar basal-body rod modification protein FlgD